MSISRASLTRGPAIVTYGGATLFAANDITARHNPVWGDVAASMYGRVDKFILAHHHAEIDDLEALLAEHVLHDLVADCMAVGTDDAENDCRSTHVLF